MKLKFELTIAVLLTFSLLSLSCSLNGKDKMRTGNEIVNKIENFNKAKGKLPATLSEIGIEEKEEGPIYYKKESETKYILWFGAILGESVTYNSDTKEWK